MKMVVKITVQRHEGKEKRLILDRENKTAKNPHED